MKLETSHENVQELLPWFANATLDPAERAVVEAHLETCDACRNELQYLMAVSTAMTDAADEAPSMNMSLAKTLAAIDRLEEEKPRSKSFAAWLSALWTSSPPVARLAFAAQFAIILALGLALLLPREHIFGTASGPRVETGGARLSIVFVPTATEEMLRKVLKDVDGAIVAGPSAIGVYVVELSGKKVDDPKVDAAIEKLRQNTGVVSFVEQEP